MRLTCCAGERGWSGEQPIGFLEVLGGAVEVVVASLQPGFPPVKVAARLGSKDQCEGILEVAVQVWVAGADRNCVAVGGVEDSLSSATRVCACCWAWEPVH